MTSATLHRFFAEEFRSYLESGNLKVVINSVEVEPAEITLPKVGEDYKERHLTNDWHKKFNCQFWFDSSGKSHVSIRHTGVTIIEDLKSYPAFAEENVYTTGFLKGYIDADFLKPLPARNNFDENQDWLGFLAELDRMRPPLEAGIEALRQEEEEKRLTEIQRRAVEIAREILDQDQFRDLELLTGLRKPRSPISHPRETHPTGKTTGTRSKEPVEREVVSEDYVSLLWKRTLRKALPNIVSFYPERALYGLTV